MTEWPGDLLGQSQAPRPLPPDVRDRLEEVLLTGDLSTEPATAELEPDLSKRLETALGDPVADALENADRPRSLPPATDKSLERAFAGRSKRRRVVLGAAAAVVLIATGLTVALSHTSHSPSNAASQAPAPTTTNPRAGVNGSGAAGSATSGAPAAPGAAAQAPTALGSDRATTPAGPEAVSAPVVAAISPDSGPAAGGTTVTITGRGMETVQSVHFGSLLAHFQIVSATQLHAVAPTHSSGEVAVTVTTAGGGSSTSSSVPFTYH
ncbi:MAG: IPT/TIG domain-containing protein [Acidimicrobiales bacterium]